MSASFDVMENALYAMFLVLLISVFVGVKLHSCNVSIHNLVCGSLPPFYTSFLL